MAKASETITLFHVVDIKETHKYYLLQSATASAPAKPTVYPPGGSWVTTEPTYTEGSTNKLYIVECTVYTDDTFEYTPVSLSSSYEAAKTAYNKAVNAQNTANNPPNKFATCSTAAGTAAKVVTLSTGSNSLKNGDVVSVKFTNANTALNPTLNVNSTGAKPILTNGVAYAYWVAGQTVMFTYDGTNWQVASAPVYANTVTVGNAASNNVYIDNDSVDIRKGDTIVATFSEEEINLGLNSKSAIIKFCNGNGYISSRQHSNREEWQKMLIHSNHAIDLEAIGDINLGCSYESDGEIGNTKISIINYSPWIGGSGIYPNISLNTSYNDTSDDTYVNAYIDIIGGNGMGSSGGGRVKISVEDLLDGTATIDLYRHKLLVDGALSNVGVIDVTCYRASFDCDVSIKGVTNHSNHIYIPNGKIIYTYDTDGNQAALVHSNSSNRAVFGHGFYSNKVGETYIYSNNACRIVTNSGGLLINGSTAVIRAWTEGTVTNKNSACTSDTAITCKYNSTSDEAVFRAYVTFKPTSTITSGTSITLCKVPSAAIPSYGTAVSIYAASTNSRRWMGFINTSGEVIVRANSDLSSGTEYSFYVYQMYRIDL